MNESSTIAIIVAAGQGTRAGAGAPKQYRPLAGKAVLAHSADALLGHPEIDSVVVVIGAGQEAAAQAALGGRDVAVVIGGDSRRQSVRNALDYLARAASPARVLIHDAARPLVPAELIDRLMAALDEAPGVVPVLPVVDTLVRADVTTVPREGLYRVQTPQAFRFDAIMGAHRHWSAGQEPTDDAQMLKAHGHGVILVEGDIMLEKLTLPADFPVAEQRLGGTMLPRVGMGYDVHRLVAGEKLWLCGVEVPHDRGLSGHSDADVALHALVDAILGALADGDIGSHFPPSDPQWRGAASARFVEHARALVGQNGGRIVHVDLTIICEAPKIGPHREAMRARVAELLQVNPGQVSIKATTTERLGFTGRREGIAAQAVATLLLPNRF